MARTRIKIKLFCEDFDGRFSGFKMITRIKGLEFYVCCGLVSSKKRGYSEVASCYKFSIFKGMHDKMLEWLSY
ncbi:unnamed protein product [Camellia sinensis]